LMLKAGLLDEGKMVHNLQWMFGAPHECSGAFLF
jgi:hypothetical protein